MRPLNSSLHESPHIALHNMSPSLDNEKIAIKWHSETKTVNHFIRSKNSLSNIFLPPISAGKNRTLQIVFA